MAEGSRNKNNPRRQDGQLFSELLESGEEIEGLFQQRRRTEMQGHKRPSRKISSSSSKNPASLLRERISIYNKKKDHEFHLQVLDEVSVESRACEKVLYVLYNYNL